MTEIKSIRPLGDRVAVRPDPADEKIGSIMLPDAAQSRPRRGTVVAAGPGRRRDDGAFEPVDVKPGDRVIFSNWGEFECECGGEKLFILRESDLYGVLGE